MLARQADAAARDRTVLLRTAALARDLDITYVAGAASVRAYFLAGGEPSLEDFNRRRAHANDLITQLDSALERRSHRAQLDAVANAARAWTGDAIDPLITLQQAVGQSNEVIENYREHGAVPKFSRLGEALLRLRTGIDVAVDSSTPKAEVARRRVARFAWAAGPAALAIFVVLAGVAMHRWTARLDPPIPTHPSPA